jgi:hypothetical protein
MPWSSELFPFPTSQVLDAYLRNRAKENGAKVYNGLFLRSSQKDGPEGAFTVNFSDYTDGGKVLRAALILGDRCCRHTLVCPCIL